MKVWMWQRLWKVAGSEYVHSELREMENSFRLCITESAMGKFNLIWLCPKPNLVLVDRKHLGGME